MLLEVADEGAPGGDRIVVRGDPQGQPGPRGGHEHHPGGPRRRGVDADDRQRRSGPQPGGERPGPDELDAVEDPGVRAEPLVGEVEGVRVRTRQPGYRDVSVIDYPDGNGKDQQINARALPVLVQETLDAQSADIDMVSGATVTSDGYLESLQSALDQAGL